MFLAETPDEVERLRKVHDVVRSEGLDSEMLEPHDVARRVPGLSTHQVQGGSFLKSDGTLYPFPALWGLYETVRSRERLELRRS